MAAVGCQLEADPGALHTSDLPAFGEQPGDARRKSPDCAAENAGQQLGLARVGALVDEEASGSRDLARPEVAFPSANPDEAQATEIDIAVMAVPDMPEQNRKIPLSGA
jgi:hypothetical protein